MKILSTVSLASSRTFSQSVRARKFVRVKHARCQIVYESRWRSGYVSWKSCYGFRPDQIMASMKPCETRWRFCRRPKQVPARIQALRWCITFALALLPPVGADSPTLAILAKRAYTIMLADRAAFAFLAGTVRCIHRRASRAQKSTCALNQEQAKSLRSKVHESNGRVALHLFILLCGHTWDPPHSLHVVFWR